jgi:uncharacterized protein (TIGR00369 family)
MDITNPAYIEELKMIVKKSPYPKHMGMSLDNIGIDRANIVLNIADYHLQPFGIVHGGVISTLIDTATFWAAFLRLPEDTGLVNVDLKLNYLCSVSKGKLTAKGSCLHQGPITSCFYPQVLLLDINVLFLMFWVLILDFR